MAALPGFAQEAGSSPASSDTSRAERRLRKITLDLADKDTSLARLTIDLDREMTTKSANHVRFGESIVVGPNERIDGDVVSIGGTVTVQGEVTGDAVAVGGRIEIADRGKVDGDVVSVGGGVSIGDSAQVFGDAVSVWGELDIAPTAEIVGERVGMGGVGIGCPWRWPDRGHHERHSAWVFFLAQLVWVLIAILLGTAFYRVFGSRMARLTGAVENQGLVAFLAGFASWILAPVVFFLLLVTIIGIPVAILQVALTPIVFLVGYVAVAAHVGRQLLRKPSTDRTIGWKEVTVGAGALQIMLLLASVSAFMGLGFITRLLAVLGLSIVWIALTIGFGAFLMTRFRAERQPVAAAPPTSTPPAS